MRGRGLVDDLPSRCKVPMSPYDFGIIWRECHCAPTTGVPTLQLGLFFFCSPLPCVCGCAVSACVCMCACACLRVRSCVFVCVWT